jgi:hypothetical protein
MQTQGLTRSLKGRGSDVGHGSATKTASAARIPLIALVVGGAIGAWSAWGMGQLVNTASGSAASSATTSVVAAPASIARKATGRPLVVSMPRENDYLTSTTIPVAGFAYGRPHGPVIRTVHIELVAGDQVIDSADLDVFSGRFAGFLSVPASSGRVDAELRITNPAHKGRRVLVTNLTVDPR